MIKIPVDYQKDFIISEFGRKTLEDRYLYENEKSPQDAFARAAVAFSDDEEHAKRMYKYVSDTWFMYSTPVLSNAPVRTSWKETPVANMMRDCFEKKLIGMPISCFLNFVPDSRKGLGDHYVENIWLASMGGGIGGYWGSVRSDGARTSNGSKSSGSIPFMHVVDSQMMAFNQGTSRRGSYAAYMDVSHPEILEFLDIRNPTGGDINRKCLNLHHGVVIPDSFMELIEKCIEDPDQDPSWDLVDPNSKNVVDTVDARYIVQKIIETRAKTGEPYIMWSDTVHRALPETQKELGLKVVQSNLCSEITLATNEDRTAVCCLSSVNLGKYDEWSKDPLFIPDLVRFLDNVLEFFIQNAPPEMHKAVYSASRERSIGIGAMGFHSYLQSKNVPIESALAVSTNRRIFKHLKERAVKASQELAMERGEPEDMKGTGLRFAHLLAVAPNATSSIIADESPSIEPNRANAYTQKTMSGSFLVKNKHLQKVFEEAYFHMTENALDHGFDFPEISDWMDDVWKSVVTNEGSVAHLDFLTDWEKLVYKTFPEHDQKWLIDLAADRQKEICQAQSLNLGYPVDISIVTLFEDFMRAWKKGVKTLYYHRSSAIRRAEVVSNSVERIKLDNNQGTECLACE